MAFAVIKTLTPSTTKKVSFIKIGKKPFLYPLDIHWTKLDRRNRYRTFARTSNVARSELRRHRLQPRRSRYRFLRVGETLRPSRFSIVGRVEFVVL